jgi:hypothetical protein
MHCIYLSISLLPTTINPVEQEREELPVPAQVHLTTFLELYVPFILL